MIKNKIFEKVIFYDLPSDNCMRIAAVNIMQYLMIAENLNQTTKFSLGFLRTKVQRKVGREDFLNGVCNC